METCLPLCMLSSIGWFLWSRRCSETSHSTTLWHVEYVGKSGPLINIALADRPIKVQKNNFSTFWTFLSRRVLFLWRLVVLNYCTYVSDLHLSRAWYKRGLGCLNLRQSHRQDPFHHTRYVAQWTLALGSKKNSVFHMFHGNGGKVVCPQCNIGLCVSVWGNTTPNWIYEQCLKWHWKSRTHTNVSKITAVITELIVHE
jgi:hypothetical protein